MLKDLLQLNLRPYNTMLTLQLLHNGLATALHHLFAQPDTATSLSSLHLKDLINQCFIQKFSRGTRSIIYYIIVERLSVRQLILLRISFCVVCMYVCRSRLGMLIIVCSTFLFSTARAAAALLFPLATCACNDNVDL